jgi:hypothetical protein
VQLDPVELILRSGVSIRRRHQARILGILDLHRIGRQPRGGGGDLVDPVIELGIRRRTGRVVADVLRWVSDRQDERLWNDYIERYHPLGYKKPFGYWARYFIESGAHRLGCILLSGAAKTLTARDRWIGWNERQRLANLPWVLNNSRYLIVPWVEVANLASHVLAHLARRVGDDWEARWGYRPLLLESFVDPARFRGSCYRAAGWALLGRTSGEGLVRPGQQYQTSPKLIFAKPLQADFRVLLCSNQLTGTTEL